MAKGNTRRRYQEQAELESDVRYGPQAAGLSRLMAQAQADYERGLNAERSGAEVLQQVAAQQTPQIRGTYGVLGEGLANAVAVSRGLLSGLSSGADRYKAIAEAEIVRAQNALAGRQAGAEDSARNFSQYAAQSRVEGQRQVRDEYRGDVDKISGEMKDLEAQAGSFSQLAARQLHETAAGRAVTKRGQDMTSESAAAGRAVTRRGQDIQAKKGGKAGKPTRGLGSRTAEQESTTKGEVEQAVEHIKKQVSAKIPTGQIRQTLLTGYKTPGGTTIPSYNKDVVNAAFDLAAKGELSTTNIKRLHDNLGLHIPREWLPKGWGKPTGAARTGGN